MLLSAPGSNSKVEIPLENPPVRDLDLNMVEARPLN